MIRHTRDEIGLAPARRLAGKAPRRRRGAVIHCPGNGPAVPDPQTLDEAFALARRVQRWHFGRGWGDVGYHLAVWRGHVLELRGADRIGAHAGRGRWPHSRERRGSFNRSHLGILVLHPGNVQPHPETLETLGHLLRFGVDGEVVPHHSLTFKGCPGRAVRRWLHREFGNRNPYTNSRGRRNR